MFKSVTFEAFAEAYISMVFSIYLSKRNAQVIKFLGIFKKYVSENKIYFCSRKKSNVLLDKKVIFVFHSIFKLDFITQVIYCISFTDVCVLISYFFLFCYVSLLEMEHRKILTFLYSYMWQQNELEKKPGVSE